MGFGFWVGLLIVVYLVLLVFKGASNDMPSGKDKDYYWFIKNQKRR